MEPSAESVTTRWVPFFGLYNGSSDQDPGLNAIIVSAYSSSPNKEWNKDNKWSDEVKQRISEGTKRNHPVHGPIGKEFMEKITRWRRIEIHREDCKCYSCSSATRLKMSVGRRRSSI